MTDRQRVLQALDYRPRKSRDLQLMTGLKDTEVRGIIRELRLEGFKICSGAGGFWIWNGLDDSWQHTKNQIKSRANELMTLYWAMENENDGQVSFL